MGLNKGLWEPKYPGPYVRVNSKRILEKIDGLRGYLQEINDNEFVIRKGLNGQEPGLRKKFLKETELYAEDLNKSQHHRGGTGRRLRGIRISSVTNKRRVELRPYYDRGWSEKTSSNCRTS